MENDYHLSFFKPTTRKALKNRNMALLLLIIWAVGVFGFQVLLRVLEEPVPEEAYQEYEGVWDEVRAGTAGDETLNIFAGSVLQVLGKVYVQDEYQAALSNAFTWSVYQIAGDDSGELQARINTFDRRAGQSEDIQDPGYMEAKRKLQNYVAHLLDIPETDARRRVIPFVLKPAERQEYTPENKELTAEAMSMYLIHNRSVLTDTRVLGFPFHYLYTAVFLLVLFVVICWLYCIITDRRELKEQK
ncbi:MAG: hypothetical protein R6U19_10735 [Bacteroidales bacterium]